MSPFTPTARRALLAALLASIVASGSSLGQGAAEEPRPALPQSADGTAAACFALAGPVSPEDTELTLITAERSCGAVFPDDEQWVDAHVAESDSEIAIRIDVALMGDGTRCRSDRQIRVPMQLEAPLGERTIRDGGAEGGEPPIVNRVDGLDTGFPYSCGANPVRVVDLLGPGIHISRPGWPRMAGGRAIADRGDEIELLGPYRRNGSAEWQLRGFHDGVWTRWAHGTCSPHVVLSPGLAGAT